MGIKAGFTVIFIFFCSGAFAQDDVVFFRELQSRKGKTFHGKVIYMPDTVKANDYWGKKLSFTINSTNDQLQIPFVVGDDKSRTWILTKNAAGLLLKHDHRHLDGSPESITNYGGNSDPEIGSKLIQYFNADEFTAKLIPAAKNNRWIMEFSPDKKKFYYILERDNILRFKAEFKL